MLYRAVANCPFRFSAIGLGGHRDGVETGDGLARTSRFFASDQQRAAIVGTAIDRGVNYFDTTYYSEIASLGRSLRLLGRRDGLVVSAMLPDLALSWGKAGRPEIRRHVRSEVEKCLAAFGHDHIDQLICGAMEMGDALGTMQGALDDAVDELLKLRQEGKFARLGFSTHSAEYAVRLLERYPAFQTVMAPYNYHNRSAEAALLPLVQQRKLMFVAIKTHVWHIYGIPVTALRHLQPIPGRLEFDPAAPIGRLALQWVLQNPLVTTTVPSMNSIAEVEENTAAPTCGPLSPEDLRHLDQFDHAMKAEGQIPLAIAALLDPNCRTQAFGIWYTSSWLKLQAPSIDWTRDTARTEAQEACRTLLSQLRAMPQYAPLLPRPTSAAPLNTSPYHQLCQHRLFPPPRGRARGGPRPEHW